MDNHGAFTSFLYFWIGWGLLMLVGGVWLFHWSVKTGQYGEANRAGMLPLDGVDLDAPAKMRGGVGHLVFVLCLCAVGMGIISVGGWLAFNAPADLPR